MANSKQFGMKAMKKQIKQKFSNKKEEKIDWLKAADYIEKQIRTFNPQPGIFCFWQKADGKLVRLKILKARVLKSMDSKTYPIGKTLVAPQNELCVQCEKGFLIIERLQIERKKEMGSEKFLRSHPSFIGTILK